jgi:hypothetical protein
MNIKTDIEKLTPNSLFLLCIKSTYLWQNNFAKLKMVGLCVWLYWYYVICVIHRLHINGSCNIKCSSIKSLQNSCPLRYNYFCELHGHIQTVAVIILPCLALQVTTTLLCVISGITVYQNSRYTQLRPENPPLPSSTTKRHNKYPHNQQAITIAKSLYKVSRY